jgi:hypothetical protein
MLYFRRHSSSTAPEMEHHRIDVLRIATSEVHWLYAKLWRTAWVMAAHLQPSAA